MRVQDLRPPTRFVFWCTAPFLIATAGLLPLVVQPPAVGGWMVVAAVELLCVLVLFGLYDPQRFDWCWRGTGAIVCGMYVAYLASMVAAGQWVGNGRRSSSSVVNAVIGLVVFGYPGFMYAVFGRFTWRAESEEADSGDDPESAADSADDHFTE